MNHSKFQAADYEKISHRCTNPWICGIFLYDSPAGDLIQWFLRPIQIRDHPLLEWTDSFVDRKE